MNAYSSSFNGLSGAMESLTTLIALPGFCLSLDNGQKLSTLISSTKGDANSLLCFLSKATMKPNPRTPCETPDPVLIRKEAFTKKQLALLVKPLGLKQKGLYQDLANKKTHLQSLLEFLSFLEKFDELFQEIGEWKSEASQIKAIFLKAIDTFEYSQLRELLEKELEIRTSLKLLKSKMPTLSTSFSNHDSAELSIPLMLEELEELKEQPDIDPRHIQSLGESIAFAKKQLLSPEDLGKKLEEHFVVEVAFDIFQKPLQSLKVEQAIICKKISDIQGPISGLRNHISREFLALGEVGEKLYKLFVSKKEQMKQQIADQEVLVNDAESALFKFFEENALVNFLKLSDAPPEVVKADVPSDEAGKTQGDEEFLLDLF